MQICTQISYAHINKKNDIHDTLLFLTFFSKVWNESVHSSHKAIVLEHNY